ncbi:s-adenosylmethionine-dependent methyltransferase [Moniliophthora roreri MCA 2997]|uniref:S-adenosylmethionine-dependent methyltransferase n=2 Tax=Moniliophthora roreri TaxID=221103 RepID=V2X4X3_MONRO|nr:s-adenosylmethionine-dependent methyltransferase [Moniliophthora roreri MCA 2997]KAI3619166.1 s-adenosylmethionine-dependent methyltransferase [Moniliophthora roreri]
MPVIVSAPSNSLPPLPHLSTFSSAQVSCALDNLRALYWPPAPPVATLPPKLILPTRKHLQVIHDDSVPDSGYASAEEEEEEEENVASIGQKTNSDDPEETEATELLRADAFERAFAIKWVTGFIARSDVWMEEVDGLEGQMREEVIEKAASILSAFTGDDEDTQCAITRSFSFPAADGGSDIHVELNDAPLSNEDHTSVGLQSWASSIVLAEKMCLTPSNFSLVGGLKPLRVLELGAGTGLLSIAAAKILRRQSKSQDASHLQGDQVFATDYHPAVLDNLSVNVKTNFPRIPSPITVLHLDWENPDFDVFAGEPFDVILAADVIYHPQHAQWIKACVERLLVRPSDHRQSRGRAGGLFWLIMPLRTTGRHENMDHTVEKIFPHVCSSKVKDSGVDSRVLAVIEVEEHQKQGGIGRADEGGYKMFKIGWVPRSSVA